MKMDGVWLWVMFVVHACISIVYEVNCCCVYSKVNWGRLTRKAERWWCRYKWTYVTRSAGFPWPYLAVSQFVGSCEVSDGCGQKHLCALTFWQHCLSRCLLLMFWVKWTYIHIYILRCFFDNITMRGFLLLSSCYGTETWCISNFSLI